MKTVAIIQARMESTRLPGKVLALINGRPMIQHVIKRAQQITVVDEVVVAIPDTPANDPLEVVCPCTVRVIRGPMVPLDRFWFTAQEVKADAIVRLTGDCPLLEPAVCNEVMLAWTGAGYIGTSPALDGLDTEVMSLNALRAAFKFSMSGYDRDHVTPWLQRRHPEYSIPGTYRWSVDDQAGLDFVRRVYAACEHCAQGVEHHTNAPGSVSGHVGRAPVWDLHRLPAGDLAECTAEPILRERMGGAIYTSP